MAKDALKIRELQRLNRQLVGAMRRRASAKKALKKAEADVRTTRSLIRQLLDEAGQTPGKAPLCDDCGKALGSNAKCAGCQAAMAFGKEG